MNSVNSISKAFLTIPQKLNPESIAGLSRQWEEIEAKSPQFIILKGERGGFCLGMDIVWLANHQGSSFSEAVEAFSSLLKKIRTSAALIIALVDGAVIGGGLGIVTASDFVIATEESTFRLTEGLLGIAPGTILSSLLNRLSPQNIKKMVFSAQKYTAQEALELRILDEICSIGQQEITANKWLQLLRGCKSQAVGDLKLLLEKERTGFPLEKSNSLLIKRLKDKKIRARIHHIVQNKKTEEK